MRSSWFAAALVAMFSMPAFPATSITALFNSIPPPPPDVAAATAWVRDGRVVAPEIVTLEANLQAAHASSLDAANNAKGSTSGTAADASAIAGAVSGYQTYIAGNSGPNAPAATLGARVQWLAKRFSGLRKRVQDQPARVAEVREQELSAYRALFRDWQSQRISLLTKAQTELAAAGDPTAIRSAEQRASIERYRAAMLNEVEVLLGLTRFSVERAAGLPGAEPASVEPSGDTLWDLMSNPRQRPPS